MKYASITVTLFFIWVAVVLIAAIVHNTDQVFQLYLMLVFFTVMMFITGFRHN